MEICFLLVIKSKIKVLSGLDPEKGSLFGLQMAPMSSQAFPQCVYLERERSLSYFPYLDKGAAAAAAKLLQLCLTLCDPIDGSPSGSTVPGILQARTLERDCHFLLQCMKVKSESEVAQSCLTLSDPVDCSLPGSSV